MKNNLNKQISLILHNAKCIIRLHRVWYLLSIADKSFNHHKGALFALASATPNKGRWKWQTFNTHYNCETEDKNTSHLRVNKCCINLLISFCVYMHSLRRTGCGCVRKTERVLLINTEALSWQATFFFFNLSCAAVFQHNRGVRCSIWYYDMQEEPVWLPAMNHERCVSLLLYYTTCWVSPSV